MKINITGLKDFTESIGEIAQQIPFALSLTLNDLAFEIKEDLRADLYTQMDINRDAVAKAYKVKKSNKKTIDTVGALVYIPPKNWQYNVLSHHDAGGDRERKGLEQMLIKRGLIGKSQILTPGRGAKVKRSAYKAMASSIQGGKTKGRGVGGVNFFVVSPTTKPSHLSDGVYGTFDGGSSRVLAHYLHVVDKPNYRDVLDLESVAKKTLRENGERLFRKNLKKTLG